jgi:hypothetical protein
VAGAIELIRGCQPARPRADNADGLAGPRTRSLVLDPAFRETAIDNGVLDILDCYGWIGNSENARALTWGWTGPARELREVIGLVQTIQRLTPPTLVHKVVPLGNQVIDWAACIRLTEWHPAVHTPSALPFEILLVGRSKNLPEVFLAIRRVPIGDALLAVLHETGRLTHRRLPQPLTTENSPV